MSVTDVGVLHSRYVRLNDRFKSIWTYHQFASGIYRNFLEASVPYTIDFRKIHERMRAIHAERELWHANPERSLWVPWWLQARMRRRIFSWFTIAHLPSTF